MKTAKERIEMIISKLCDSKADFARKMGEKPQTISNWVSRGLGKNVLDKIIAVFPQINYDWLLTGEGEMLKYQNTNKGEDVSNESHQVHGIDTTNQIIIPQSVWDVIERQSKNMELQAKSLSRKDDQIDKLIEIIENQKGVAGDANNVAPKEVQG